MKEEAEDDDDDEENEQDAKLSKPKTQVEMVIKENEKKLRVHE